MVQLRLLAVGVSAALLLGGVGCEKRSPITPTECTLSLTPTSRLFTADASSATIDVSASASTCEWTVASNASWAPIVSPASNTGSGTITYNVAANSSVATRAAVIAVGPLSHAVVQAPASAPCAYRVDPTSIVVPADASTARVMLTTGSDCGWQANSLVDWITVASAAAGVGSTAVELRVDANRRETVRTGAIVVAEHRIEVTQAGESQPVACGYSVTPVQFSPCMPAGTVATRINTSDRCTWTVSTDAPWLTLISSSSGSGSADIVAQFSSNFEAPRLGRLLVRWPSPTAGQNVQVQQAGCRYGVSRTRIDVAAGSGTATFDVVQQSDPTGCGGATQDRCVWSAVADVEWIEMTTSFPRSGDDRVSFTVRPNPSAQARTGRIAVRDQRVDVVQAGQ